MLIVRLLIRLFPKFRVIRTRRDSPKEASHAPNVRRIINIKGELIGSMPVENIIRETKRRTELSKHRRHINKCFR